MTSVQERIKELGLKGANKAGGRRNAKKKVKTTLNQKLASMIQEGKPIPKHLAKKAEEILKSLQMAEPKVQTTTDGLPTFEQQEQEHQHDHNCNHEHDDDEEIPSLIFDEENIDLPSSIEEIQTSDNIVVL